MRKLHLLLLLTLVAPACFATAAICVTKLDKAGISSITVQEIPEWEPGQPRIIRQVVLLSDGTAQEARFEDSRIVGLRTYRHRLFAPAPFPYEAYFLLNDRYLEEEIQPGLIREGNPPMTRFIFLYKNNLKHIDCQTRIMPKQLVDLKEQIDSLSHRVEHDGMNGAYVMSQPLSHQERTEVERLLAPQGLSPAELRRWPAMRDALAKPSLLIHLPESELESLKKDGRFKGRIFSESGIFITADWGLAKVSFFMKQQSTKISTESQNGPNSTSD